MLKVKDFSKLPKFAELPAAVNIQIRAYREFLQMDKKPEERENKGLEKIFREIFPLEDIHGGFKLEYVGYELKEPIFSPEEAIERGATYAAPLLGIFRLTRFTSRGEIENVIEQKVYICDMPLITDDGCFIINGIKRVVVAQLLRSPGIYFIQDKGAYQALVVPERGSWFEIDVSPANVLLAVLERKRKVPLFMFLRSLGYTHEEIASKFFKTAEKEPKIGEVLAADVRLEDGTVLAYAGETLTENLISYIKERGIEKVKVIAEDRFGVKIFCESAKADRSKTPEDALRKMYNRLRGVNPSSLDLAKRVIFSLVFDPNRFNLGVVGRYKLNRKFGRNDESYVLTPDDILNITQKLIEFAERRFPPDDMDHLANRRVKGVNEQIENVIRPSIFQLVQIARERASFLDESKLTPLELLNSPVVSNSITAFFATSSVSQFMEEVNPLSELTHKRRFTALGPGGLTKETAGFEVRDVHYSHYGRICPIETPEGQNIGLITSLALYSDVNKYGFIVTPYIKVKNGKITHKIDYISAEDEENYTIAQIGVPVDKDGTIKAKEVVARRKGEIVMVPVEEVDYIEYSPKQLFSPSTCLIPFLEHDDADRALMGSNMQRQAVPLIEAEPPLVATGVERIIAEKAGSVIKSKVSGVVKYVDARRIIIETKDGFTEYSLRNFEKSNQYTCIHFRPAVKPGDKIKKGDIIANGPSTAEGMLALGKNVLVAFMPLWGYNYEDAIVVSERLLKDDVFTSIQVLEYEIEARETKLGPEEITRDIPGATEHELMNLDEYGIIRIGAEVGPDDILVGRITPRGDVEMTPEERLLRAIFGEKAANVRDTSLRVDPGVRGIVIGRRILTRNTNDPLAKKVINERIKMVEKRFAERKKMLEEQRERVIKEFLLGKYVKTDVKDRKGKLVLKKREKFTKEILNSIGLSRLRIRRIEFADEKENEKFKKILKEYDDKLAKLEKDLRNSLDNAQRGDDLPLGVLKSITIYVAQKRKLSVGDKLSGRHGNKGVVSKILPVEDMPYLPDGTPVDMVLNTLGVPSRMNIGQILEAILGYAAKKLGYQAICPVFEGATIEEIKEELKKAGLSLSGKIRLRDGRTGETFDQEATVGYMYMMKLIHMVEDKIHARSTGRYSLITQQPLGGKAQFGGQRLGEMEVWALEAYGASYNLQEMLTIKSDDVEGRNRLYEALIRGEIPPAPKKPASFSVLVKELRGLGLNVIPIKEKKNE